MISKIARNFYNPRWWIESAIPYARSELSKKYSHITYKPNYDTIYVMQEDWDNLIILDACRFDQFERINNIPGELEARTSPASLTADWLSENFKHKKLHDTVYVTANPQYASKNYDYTSAFHDTVDVWDSNWNEEHNTVLPSDMASAVLKAAENYPNKRLISHFVQPHYPFLGETAVKIGEHAGGEQSYRKAKGETSVQRDAPVVWDMAKKGNISDSLLREAYNENLKITLPHVEKVINKLEGKTIVSSDHGNFTGERLTWFDLKRYGHPRSCIGDAVRDVPWLIIENESRKSIKSEKPPKRNTNNGMESVSERLADLGYKT